MRSILITSYLVLLASSALALPDSWGVNINDHTAVQRTYKQGETWTMQPTLRNGLKPLDLTGATAKFLWYTNATDNLWWEHPAAITAPKAGLLSAEWTPAMDTGAALYHYWFCVYTAGSTSPLWRVTGTIRLLPSPGFVPNTLLPPIRTLDFAAVALTNAPWLTTADWTSGSNALAGALQQAVQTQAETNALFSTWLDGILSGTNAWWQAAAWGNHALAGYAGTQLVAAVAADVVALSNTIANLPPPTDPTRLIGTNQYIDGDGGVWKWAVTTNIVVTFSSDFSTEDGHKPPQQSYPFPFQDAGFDCHPRDDYIALMFYSGEYEAQWANNSLTIPARLDPLYNARGYATVDYQVVTSRVDAVALQSDVVAATNAIVQTYLIGTDAWMTVSNQTLTVWRVTDGVTNAHVIGGGGTSVDPTATNLLWLALSSGLDTKAPKAWGTLAPDGSANPDPEFMTFLNAPVVMHASGFQWATSGGHAVLAESGAVAFGCAGENGGELRIGPDVCSNYFGFVRGESLTIGATPSGIYVTNPGSEEGVAQIVYPYAGGDFPVLWFAPSLSVPFGVLEGVVWADQENGFAIATAPATTASGFWYATTTLSVDAYFVSTMPARFIGGVVGGTNAAPVVYDSTVTITSGGKTYRIPAQEVE